MLTGVDPEEVIALIKRRVSESQFGRPERKLGLLIEGGAMRGVYTAGSLLGLHQLGANAVFDAVYGTSAGALNAVHFLAGDGPRNIAAYYKILTDRRFYNPRRIHKIVDIDFLIDVVMRREYLIDFAKARRSPAQLKIAVLNWDRAKAEVLELPKDDGEAMTLLHAGVALPILYNRLIDFRGAKYADAGMVVPFPLEQAIEDGMTDLLVLLTHDPAAAPSQRHKSVRRLYRTFFAKGRDDLMEIFDRWPQVMLSHQRRISGVEPLPRTLRIAVIAPRWELIGKHATDPAALKDECAEMAGHLLEIFGSPERVVLPD